MTDRLAGRLVSPPARASARKRADTDDETRQETGRRCSALSAEQRAKARIVEVTIIIIVAQDFRLPEVLRHIEAGKIVHVIPAPRNPAD